MTSGSTFETRAQILCRQGNSSTSFLKEKNMADRPEENGLSDTEAKDGEQRPRSGRSKGSADSGKSIQDAVSKLTVKALKEFRLSDPSDVDTIVTGAESEGLVPTATLLVTQDIPAFNPQGAPGAQTLLSEGISGSGEDAIEDEIGGDDGEDRDEDLIDEESGSDGESDMVVLDPDHVSGRYFPIFSIFKVDNDNCLI